MVVEPTQSQALQAVGQTRVLDASTEHTIKMSKILKASRKGCSINALIETAAQGQIQQPAENQAYF